MPGNSRAGPGLRYNNMGRILSRILQRKRKARKNGAYAPTLLSNKNETLCPPLRTCVPPLPLPVGYATQLVTRIEHKEDDVGLVDDFVQHTDVVSPPLFLRLVGSCRRRVGRGRRDVGSRCGLCELGW
jgi:hypothetical protein